MAEKEQRRRERLGIDLLRERFMQPTLLEQFQQWSAEKNWESALQMGEKWTQAYEKIGSYESWGFSTREEMVYCFAERYLDMCSFVIGMSGGIKVVEGGAGVVPVARTGATTVGKGAGEVKNLSKLPVQAGEAGSYGDLAAMAIRGAKLTPHHMPQAATKFTPYSEGGSLVLPETEHFLTRTFGRKGSATLVEDAGLSFRQTLYKDIKDIRSFSGSKYNSGLMDLLDYYKQNFLGLMKK